MLSLGLGLVSNRLRGASTALSNWFLTSGVWQDAGAWIDRVQWDLPWFLATGNFNLSGFWNDAQSWE